MEYCGGKYEGQMQNGRFEGFGVYTFPDGSKYEGEFSAGMFHGKGSLVTASGTYTAVWEHGKEMSGSYAFADGLEYSESNWQYCSGSDRRFQTEIVAGKLKPAGESQFCNPVPAPSIPVGCYDVADGYFDPSTKRVYKYGTRDELRVPAPAEMKWILERCRLSAAE